MTRAWDQIKREEAALLRQWPGDTRPVRIQRLREMQVNVRDLLTRVETRLLSGATEPLVTAYETGAWGAALQLSTETAVARSAARGLRTGRVVPNSVIREVHVGVSEIYPQVAKYFDITTLVSNETEPTVIARGVLGESLEILDWDLWRAFLAKAGL